MQPLQPQLQSLIEHMRGRGVVYHEAVHEFKKSFVLVALRENKSNQIRTARALGMHRNTLTRQMAELGIPPKRARVRQLPHRATAAIRGALRKSA